MKYVDPTGNIFGFILAIIGFAAAGAAAGALIGAAVSAADAWINGHNVRDAAWAGFKGGALMGAAFGAGAGILTISLGAAAAAPIIAAVSFGLGVHGAVQGFRSIPDSVPITPKVHS